jgi:hypothetical protein
MFKNVPAYYKAIVGALGGVATTVGAVLGLGGILPHAVSGWLTGALAVVTAVGVYLTKNQIVPVPPAADKK